MCLVVLRSRSTHLLQRSLLVFFHHIITSITSVYRTLHVTAAATSLTMALTAMTSWITMATLVLTSVRGSELILTASPQDIQPPMTHKLWMKCSLSDVIPDVTGSHVVGRSVPGTPDDDDDDDSHDERAAPTSAGDPIRHVATISITRDGVSVATVSPYHAARAESSDDVSNIHVTGDVSKTTGELGYLELVWDFPTEKQVGAYECSVTGITESGHSVTFGTSLEVGRSYVNLNDIIADITELKKELHQQNVTNNELQQTVAQQQTQLSAQKIQINDLNATEFQLQQTVAKQQAQLSAQSVEISHLQAELNHSQHVETGSIHCSGNSLSWTSQSKPAACDHGDQGEPCYFQQEKTMNASFTADYSRPPKVFLATKFLYVKYDSHVHYGVKLLSVDQHGFSIMCGSGPAHWTVEDMEVSWISVPV